jgi:hypothetical protein
LSAGPPPPLQLRTWVGSHCAPWWRRPSYHGEEDAITIHGEEKDAPDLEEAAAADIQGEDVVVAIPRSLFE